MKLRIASISILISTLFYSQLTIQTRDNASITTAGTNSGFFQTPIPQNFPTGADGWWYLLDTRHGDPRYAMQLSGSFFNQDLWFRKIDPGIPNQAWSKILMENASGKVGINLGADLPRETLEINGNIRIGKDNNNSWIFHAPNDTRKSLFIAPFLSTGVANWDKQIVFRDGNIAINGKLEAQEVKVTQSPSADFVFEYSYALPTLEEVEKHIKEKKHLPEIG